MKNIEKNTIQSVERAIQILEYISMNTDTRLQDIYQHLELKKSTVFSLIKTLEKNNYVIKSTLNRYSLGAKIFQLGQQYDQQFNLKNVISTILTQLRDISQETCYFITDVGDSYVFIDKVESLKRMKSSTPLGHKEFINTTSAVGSLLSKYHETQQIPEYTINSEKIEKGMVCMAFPLIKKGTLLGVIAIEGSIIALNPDTIPKIVEQWAELTKQYPWS